MATVRQSGGDYSTLNAACAAAQTTIDIDQSWTINDTTKVTISTANTVITVSGGARHAGVINESTWTHHRLVCTAGHCITVALTAAGSTINGLVIHQDGTGASDEGVRVSTTSLTMLNCIIYGNSTYVSDQDGIYIPQGNHTGAYRQCLIFNFRRGGIRYSAGGTSTINVNSCTAFNCSQSGETDGGGFTIQPDAGSSVTLNAHNSVALLCYQGGTDADFYKGGAGTSTFNISNCIDSDGSIAANLNSGSNNLGSRTHTDSSSPGAGDWVVFNNVTTYPYDLRLKSNAENDAQDRHANAAAHSLTIPSTDIVGTARPQNTNYDVGWFEIVAAAAASLVPRNRRRAVANLMRF